MTKCLYCANPVKDRDLEYYMQPFVDTHSTVDMTIAKEPETGKHLLVLKETRGYYEFEIKYCPNCGRRLEDNDGR